MSFLVGVSNGPRFHTPDERMEASRKWNPLEYVYLMYNCRNEYTKIGRSKKPQFREKTLQSQEPEVILLAVRWGSRKLDKALHRKFADLCIRGEWFNLQSEELTELLLALDFQATPEGAPFLNKRLGFYSDVDIVVSQDWVSRAKNDFMMFMQDGDLDGVSLV